jgi:hypothetical protein
MIANPDSPGVARQARDFVAYAVDSCASKAVDAVRG